MFKPLVICYYVEGSLSSTQKKAIEDSISHLYSQSFSAFASCKLIWMRIPKGQAYLENKHSTAATLLAPVPDHTEQTLRAQFLYRLLDTWCALTHSPRDGVVITAPDQALAKGFISASRNRMPVTRQIGYVLKLIARLIRSKFKAGFLETPVNF